MKKLASILAVTLAAGVLATGCGSSLGSASKDSSYSDADTSVFLQHVADGSQDFTIIDLAMYNSYMEEFNYDVQKNDIPEDEAKMIAENSYAYYIFPQDQKDLREQVDKALKELKEDGTLTEISKKWYGQDAAPEDDKFEETIN